MLLSLTTTTADGSFLFPSNTTDHNRMGFAVTMAFMVLALVMALLLKYLLAKYPYPELQLEQSPTPSGHDGHETHSKA